MGSRAKLRVAVVGAGGWGYQHLRVFDERDDVEVVGVFGRTAAKVAARARRFGVVPFTDLPSLLDLRPDLVSISLPNQSHFEVTRQVIRAGLPLLVEKPLVFDVAEADVLLAEARQAGDLFFAVNFNHRYARPVQLAKAAIDDGRVGEVVFAHWRFGGEGGADHPFGNLIETQCHGFDLLEHLCGPIASVAAQMTDKTRPGAFTTVAVALRFANGAVGTLLGSYDASYSQPGTHQLEVNGTKGRVRVEDTVRSFTFHAHGSEVGQTWQAGYFNDTDREFHRTFDRHVDDLLAALRDGRPPPVPAAAGRRALVLAEACVRSFRQGRTVTVE